MSDIDLALWDLLGKERFEVRDGMIEIPERPGLGVTGDESFVERYAVARPWITFGPRRRVSDGLRRSRATALIHVKAAVSFAG